jgi:Zn-dependent protease with chaperone function
MRPNHPTAARQRPTRRAAILASVCALALSACAPLPSPGPSQRSSATSRPVVATPAPPKQPPQAAARNFVTVVRRMEPVAEAQCRARTPRGTNCDYQILVDDRPDQPPNAFQTLDRNGRPVIVFTLGLIADARNADEIAFVLGHEAAHHIAGHIPRTQQTALTGALLLGTLAALGGGDAGAIDAAQQIGATVGSRTFSKEFELEADRLGTVITYRTGYDPVRGAAFFTRIPDPGNRFLGSHPPNAARIETVRRTMAELRR